VSTATGSFQYSFIHSLITLQGHRALTPYYDVAFQNYNNASQTMSTDNADLHHPLAPRAQGKMLTPSLGTGALCASFLSSDTPWQCSAG